MIKSITLFYILVIAGSTVSLFIPFWFLPFFLALIVSYLFDISKSKAIVPHLIIYTFISILFCYFSFTTGSQKLAEMIAEIFNGISVTILMIVSGLITGITASLGAWVGVELKLYFLHSPKVKN